MTARHWTVAGLILAAVITEVLATATVGLTDRPVLEVAAGIPLGAAIAASLLTLPQLPQLRRWWGSRAAGSRIINRPFWLMALTRFDWPLLAISANWLGITPTAIIWGIKPITSIIFLRCLVHDAAGLASTTLAGLAGVRFEWCLRLARQAPPAKRRRPELAIVIAGLVPVSLLAATVLLLLNQLGGGWPAWDNLRPGLVVGGLVGNGWALASAGWLKTRRLEFAGLFYLTPPLSVLLLLGLGRLGQINPWLLVPGGLLILTASLALLRADHPRQTTNRNN